MNKIQFLVNYTVDCAVSYSLLKHYYDSAYPDHEQDLITCGSSKIQDKIADLEMDTIDTLVIVGFNEEIPNSLFSKVGQIVRFAIEDIEESLSERVKLYIESVLNHDLKQFKKLTKLMTVLHKGDKDSTGYSIAFNLELLFWQKRFWKFVDVYCGIDGFSEFSTSDMNTIKRIHKKQIADIDNSPQKEFSATTRFIFLREPDALSMCLYKCGQFENNFIIVPNYTNYTTKQFSHYNLYFKFCEDPMFGCSVDYNAIIERHISYNYQVEDYNRINDTFTIMKVDKRATMDSIIKMISDIDCDHRA